MRGLLADVNAGGYLAAILKVCRGPAWRSFWLELRVPTFSFRDLWLDQETQDDLLWQFCQSEQLVLFTDNRNETGATSLGRAIRELNTASSLPVLTPADAQRLYSDAGYAERAAERMLEILMEIDRYRGTGRLFLPREG
jgi:hypothetical protein